MTKDELSLFRELLYRLAYNIVKITKERGEN